MTVVEKSLLAFAALLLATGAILSFTHPDYFATGLTVEDGPVEWFTVVMLLSSMGLCASRVVKLSGKRNGLFIMTYCILTLFFFFGAGEEISWGQRLFGIESGEFFMENNAQRETNLHNLMVGDTKINKLIFGTGISLVLFTYVCILTPLYTRNQPVRRFLIRFGVPIPKSYHIVAYVVLLSVVQLIMTAGRRGEMIEVVGSIIVFLNLAFPSNSELFDPEKPAEELT